MIKKLPWPEITVTLLVLAIGAGVYIYAHRDVGQIEESKRIGAVLVDGLYRYQAAHGTYPDDLAQLAPDWVAEVEPPTWGLGRWRYRRYTAADVAPDAAAADSTREYFQLSVAASESGYPVLYYDPEARRWVLNN
jgi:hypothetical protein